MATPNMAAVNRALRDSGFFLWRDYLSARAIARIKTLLRQLERTDALVTYRRSKRIWALVNHGELFASMVMEPRLRRVVAEVLGPEFLLSDFSANVVYPGSQPDKFHIDYPFNEMKARPVKGVLGVQCVLAIDDFTRENGATELVPGSHPLCTSPPSNHRCASNTCLMQAGSLLLMAASTWHRAGVNRSGRDRRALLFSFVERWVRPMTAPDEYSDTLIRSASPELKMLLGVLRYPETIDGVALTHSKTVQLPSRIS